jgi:hypothetical protein
MHCVGAGFRPGSFLSIFLILLFMKISKIKSFVFGLAFLGSLAFGGISANAQGMGGPGNGGEELKWKQLYCSTTGSFFEICFLSGDGNSCDEWGTQTRDCPPF